MRFGDNLKTLRKSKNLSQEDLAEKMNVSRQSVSKWETGAAYPEMNNILELCKIFHCKINDLVNASITDIDSLDDEIKTNVVKFKKDQQKSMKSISKAISVIARIGEIVCYVAIPIVVLLIIGFTIIMSKISVENNEIILNGTGIFTIIEEENKVSLKIFNMLIADMDNPNQILAFKQLIEHGYKNLILTYVDGNFLIGIAKMVLFLLMLRSLNRLFTNINKGDTPFTLENVDHIKKIAYLMAIILVFPTLYFTFNESHYSTRIHFNLELSTLVEILFLLSIAYIFRYGYEIQLDSKGKMYGDVIENESQEEPTNENELEAQ